MARRTTIADDPRRKALASCVPYLHQLARANRNEMETIALRSLADRFASIAQKGSASQVAAIFGARAGTETRQG